MSTWADHLDRFCQPDLRQASHLPLPTPAPTLCPPTAPALQLGVGARPAAAPAAGPIEQADGWTHHRLRCWLPSCVLFLQLLTRSGIVGARAKLSCLPGRS